MRFVDKVAQAIIETRGDARAVLDINQVITPRIHPITEALDEIYGRLDDIDTSIGVLTAAVADLADRVDALENTEDPEPEPDPGLFPTILNAGWANWNLTGVPVTVPDPPPLPTLPDVPADAVDVNPATIQTEVANRPAGTAFRLQAGTYQMTLPTKAGNQYFGDPDDWEAVVFDGGYSRNAAVERSPAVGLHYMAFEKFVGYAGDSSPSGAIDPGSDGWRIVGCHIRWNKNGGLRATGSNNHVLMCHVYQNGAWAASGPAAGWLFDCVEVWGNSNEDTLPAFVPAYTASSDRGATKFGQNYNLDGTSGGPTVVRRWHAYDNKYDGIWFDIRIEDVLVEYSWFEDQRRYGVNLEAGRPGGRPIVVRYNLFDHCGYQSVSGSWWQPSYIALPAAVRFAVCENVEVYGNRITGGPRGIGGYNWNHPQLNGSASTPGAGTVNATPVQNCWVHGNYVELTDGGANPSTVAGGITDLGTPGVDPYAANNRWEDNVYADSYQFEWDSGAVTYSQWQAIHP